MKKLISLILVVLLLCMALPTMAEEDITGDWYLKTMKMGDQEYDAAAIGFAITMTLNADGTSSMSMPDSEEALVGTWALDGDKITVTINDEPVSGIVTDGAITLSQDGQDMIFTREAVEGITLAETKAAESAAPRANPAEGRRTKPGSHRSSPTKSDSHRGAHTKRDSRRGLPHQERFPPARRESGLVR